MSTMVNGAVEDSMLNVGEAADLLGVHPNTLRRWEAQGIIRAWRIGPRHDRRFVRSEVERLLDGNGQLIPQERDGHGIIGARP